MTPCGGEKAAQHGLIDFRVGHGAALDDSLTFNAQLLGVRLYLQAYAEAPGANPAGFTTSNGVAWTIGI